MLTSRLYKVLGDIRHNFTRSLLVVLSVAIGVFAIGTVTWSRNVILSSVAQGDSASRVAGAVFDTTPFDQSLVRLARRQPGVQDAEGRTRLTLRIRSQNGEWHDLWLFAINDFHHIRVNALYPDHGWWPPPLHEISLERSSLPLLNGRTGGTVGLQLPNGSHRAMRVAGTVYDLNQVATPESGIVYGYVTLRTLAWLGEPRTFNQLYISVTGNRQNAAHVRRVESGVRAAIERTGRQVSTTLAPAPGKTWVDSPVNSIGLLINSLTIPILFMSGFLVIDIISALMAQHERQIGVMKATGARGRQIAVLYLLMVALCCIAALLIAVPLSGIGARALISYTTGLLNLTTVSFSLSPSIVVLELSVGFLVPLLAALVPVLRGSRMTVREAISPYREPPATPPGLDKLNELPRPLLLALGNAFRRPARLALMLSALTLAGAIVIAVASVRASMLQTLDDTFGVLGYDAQLTLNRPYNAQALVREAKRVPGVLQAEAWGQTNAERVDNAGARGTEILLIAPPVRSPMVRPALLSGRWLRPGDGRTVVMTSDVLRYEPDLRVGQRIKLSINRVTEPWTIVGLVRGVQKGAIAYVANSTLAHETGTVGQASSVQLITRRHDARSQTQAAQALASQLSKLGLSASSTVSTADWRATDESFFNVIVIFLVTLGLLLAITGGLGLMGMMSINVLERTKEIGVLRAVGASYGEVLRIVMTEGLIVGVLSWALGAVLAVPLGIFLSNALGVMYLLTPLAYTFSWSGVVLWFGGSLLLAALASFLPARSASRITVSDALAYEG